MCAQSTFSVKASEHLPVYRGGNSKQERGNSENTVVKDASESLKHNPTNKTVNSACNASLLSLLLMHDHDTLVTVYLYSSCKQLETSITSTIPSIIIQNTDILRDKPHISIQDL